MRGALASAYGARGHLSSDLFYAYSPRMDEDVVLRGALEFAHFLLTESDPTIAGANYAPAEKVTLLAGGGIASLVTAEVVDNKGSTTWREVKASQALERSNSYRMELRLSIQRRISDEWPTEHAVFTELEIYANPQRIRNWNRVIAWLSQARQFPLVEERHRIIKLIRERRRVSLGEVLSLGR